jgi:hypothetical protein
MGPSFLAGSCHDRTLALLIQRCHGGAQSSVACRTGRCDANHLQRTAG